MCRTLRVSTLGRGAGLTRMHVYKYIGVWKRQRIYSQKFSTHRKIPLSSDHSYKLLKIRVHLGRTSQLMGASEADAHPQRVYTGMVEARGEAHRERFCCRNTGEITWNRSSERKLRMSLDCHSNSRLITHFLTEAPRLLLSITHHFFTKHRDVQINNHSLIL